MRVTSFVFRVTRVIYVYGGDMKDQNAPPSTLHCPIEAKQFTSEACYPVGLSLEWLQ